MRPLLPWAALVTSALVALPAVSAVAPCLAAVDAHGPPGGCRQGTAALREHLEQVLESCIEGRAARVKPAARATWSWWLAHRVAFPESAAAESALLDLRATARTNPLHAAGEAYRLAAWSLDWCPGVEHLEDRLMRIDLIGMAGWLRARDEAVEWPRDAGAAVEAIGLRLEAGNHAGLAARVRRAVGLVLDTPARDAGAGAHARALLDLVDRAENALH